jgi:hypothetical protein
MSFVTVTIQTRLKLRSVLIAHWTQQRRCMQNTNSMDKFLKTRNEVRWVNLKPGL